MYIGILGVGDVFFQENCDGYQYFLYTTFRMFWFEFSTPGRR